VPLAQRLVLQINMNLQPALRMLIVSVRCAPAVQLVNTLARHAQLRRTLFAAPVRHVRPEPIEAPLAQVLKTPSVRLAPRAPPATTWFVHAPTFSTQSVRLAHHVQPASSSPRHVVEAPTLFAPRARLVELASISLQIAPVPPILCARHAPRVVLDSTQRATATVTLIRFARHAVPAVTAVPALVTRVQCVRALTICTMGNALTRARQDSSRVFQARIAYASPAIQPVKLALLPEVPRVKHALQLSPSAPALVLPLARTGSTVTREFARAVMALVKLALDHPTRIVYLAQAQHPFFQLANAFPLVERQNMKIRDIHKSFASLVIPAATLALALEHVLSVTAASI
jgi:hypothetical protein